MTQSFKLIGITYVPESKLALPPYLNKGWAAPWLRRLVAGFPPRRPGFKPGSGHVGFCDRQRWR
jgi:hypothetical protein